MAKGLKINNDKSTVAAPVIPASEILEKGATEAAIRIADYKKRSWELGTQFKNVMESSILQENKSAIFKDWESETLAKLSKLADDINNDDSQPEGTGSTILCQLIMKILIFQKDNSNLIKYRVESLEKELKALKAKA